MDTESLHTLSAATLGLGLVLTGIGGFGLYFKNAAQADGKPQSPAGESQLRAKIAALKKSNDELRERLRSTGQQPSAAASAPKTKGHPESTAQKTAAPWAGASLLEEMIESSIAAEPANPGILSDKQRVIVTNILRKYKDRSITVHSVEGDDAGFNFAWALKAAFVEAGWHVEGVEKVPYSNPPAGLFITSGPSSPIEDAIIPHEALTTAGLVVSRCVDSNLKGDRTVLLVGAIAK